MREVGAIKAIIVNISLMIAMLGLGLRAEAGGRVYTANMESGTISVIDPDKEKQRCPNR